MEGDNMTKHKETECVRDWKSVFFEMESQWKSPLEEKSGTTDERGEEKEGEWQTEYDRMTKEYIELRLKNKWNASPPDILSIIGRQEHENRHSDMLAWLLDPMAPHGLGEGFVSSFFYDVFGKHIASLEDFRKATVEREVTAENTREDIIVWLPNATVVIEAKVNAQEGDRQCEKIYGAFTGNDHIPKVYFIFLTRDGEEPESENERIREAFYLARFSTVAQILDNLVNQNIKDQRTLTIGSMSVLNYLETLKEVF